MPDDASNQYPGNPPLVPDTHLPANPSGADSPSPNDIDIPPILEIEEDACPRCRNILRPGELVCVKCGFDLRTNTAHQPTVAVEHVDELPLADDRTSLDPISSHSQASPSHAGGSVAARAKHWLGGLAGATSHASTTNNPKHLQDEFSSSGRGSVRTILLFAAALVVSAMVMAGIDSYAHTARFLPTLGRVVLTLYITLLATGLGLAAVAVVARICDRRLGRPDLATARILLAFSAFQALRGISFPGPPLLVHLLMWIAGIAAYWGLVMLLFKKSRHIAGYVLVTHFVLYLALIGGMELAGWVSSAEHAAPKPPVATTP